MNEIHPTAIIDERVRLGRGTKILAYTILQGPLEIGEDTIIGPHVVIGTPGQDTKNRYYDSSECLIRIGSRTIIREFSSVVKPSYRDLTRVGDDAYLMQNAQISHDVILENKVTLAPSVALAGLVHVLEGANLGMSCSVTQYGVVGAYSIVATNAAATKNVKPFSRFIPGMAPSVNHYAIEKNGFISWIDEISRYVLEGQTPRSDEILKHTERFAHLAAQSGRKTY